MDTELESVVRAAVTEPEFTTESIESFVEFLALHYPMHTRALLGLPQLEVEQEAPEGIDHG
jgi:hypothetical protein